MRRLLVLLALVPAAAVAGCGSNGKEAPTKGTTTAATTATATTSTAAAQATDDAGCVKVAAPKPKGPGHLKRPSLALSPSKTYTVTLQTNCGPMAIRLDIRRAPKTASSFGALVKSGFYDDLTFHRVVQGFVIQGGDPQGNGQGGPGYSIVEKPPSSLQYVRGVVAMAKSSVEAPGTSGSQFFIVTAPDAQLPPQYALVGRVTAGMKVADKITNEPVNAQSFPLNPVVIQKATLSP